MEDDDDAELALALAMSMQDAGPEEQVSLCGLWIGLFA